MKKDELKLKLRDVLCIKSIPAARKAECAGCRTPVEVGPGPALVTTNDHPVCAACGWVVAVELMTLLELAEVADAGNPRGEFWRSHRAVAWGRAA